MTTESQPAAAAPAATPSEPPAGYFSREYVSELRAENKGYRLKASESQRLVEEAQAKLATADKARETAVADANVKAETRIKRAECRAEATKLGMIDLDGLAFLDYTTLKFDDKGELSGVPEALEKLKTSKPYLFEVKKSTGSTGQAPPPKSSTEPVDARSLSPAEYKAMKAAMGLR